MLLTDRAVRSLVEQTYPFYYTSDARWVSFVSDKTLSLALPVIVYWTASLVFHAFDVLRPAFTERYRLHPPAEVASRNRVSMQRVIYMVILQHLIQSAMGIVFVENTANVGGQRVDVDPQRDIAQWVGVLRVVNAYMRVPDMIVVRAAIALYWWGVPWLQFWFSCFLMDAWQYMLHRTMHEVRFLYRLLHSHHHRLYVPYAFGALYNHPLEGLLLDTLGAEFSRLGSFMTLRQTVVFFTLSTFKTVCDHGGYAFPWYFNPIHALFPNNAEYHDVHHQIQGLRYNYSQPFFVHFDTLLGTRVDPSDFRAMLAQRRGKAVEAAAESEAEAEVKSVATSSGISVGESRQRKGGEADMLAQNAQVMPFPTPRGSSPYTTASSWSVVLFVGILVVPVLIYSIM